VLVPQSARSNKPSQMVAFSKGNSPTLAALEVLEQAMSELGQIRDSPLLSADERIVVRTLDGRMLE
jgi:hypothetical protein